MSIRQHQDPTLQSGNQGGSSRQKTPDCPHNYPVAATETGLGSALSLAKRTLPYAWYRYVESVLLSAVNFAFLTVLVALTIGAYVYVHKYAGGALLIAGALGLIFWLLPMTDRQSFVSHCGHIALLTNLVTHGEVGNGQEKMFKFGRALALSRLGELDTIWRVNAAIRDTTRRAVRTLNFIDHWLPIDLSIIKRVIYRVVDWAMPYINAVVLSYGIARKDNDFANAGVDGLCYSIQNAKAIVKTAIGAFLLEKVILAPLWFVTALSFGVAACMGVLNFTGADVILLQTNPRAFFQAQPILGLSALAAGLVIGPLVAHLIVKTISEAFVRPMLIAMVLLRFHVTVRNQALDAALRARLVDGNETLTTLSDTTGQLTRLAT